MTAYQSPPVCPHCGASADAPVNKERRRRASDRRGIASVWLGERRKGDRRGAKLPATLDAIAFWYEANVAGPVFGTPSAVEMKRKHIRAAAIDFAAKISKAFPGILKGGE